MLLVKTKIGPSEINGIGLFANQFISEGTPIWKFQPGLDLEIDKSELNKLPEPAKEYILKYAYLHPKTDKYVLPFDNDRFCNHSDNPNVIPIGPPPDDKKTIFIAAKDIQKGEEITDDYKRFDADFDYKMSI